MAHVVSHQARCPLDPTLPDSGTIKRVGGCGFRVKRTSRQFDSGLECPLRSESFLTLDITPGFILLDMAEAVHIGKAAKLAGVSVDTIRFYQELGLINSAGRSTGGYGCSDAYSPSTLQS